jgi:hypothetical protein
VRGQTCGTAARGPGRGLAFGLWQDQQLLRSPTNALEENVKFEYVTHKRLTRATVHQEIKKDQWYLIAGTSVAT